MTPWIQQASEGRESNLSPDNLKQPLSTSSKQKLLFLLAVSTAFVIPWNLMTYKIIKKSTYEM